MNASLRHVAAPIGATLLVSLILVAPAPPRALASPGAPTGWIRAGNAPADYEVGTDSQVLHGGRASGYLKCTAAKPTGFGTLMQIFNASAYHGKRVRLSAWVKTDKVTDWAGLWMRVDGPDRDKSLAFDNMQTRPIKGTWAWNRHEVVLDVASNATNIAFGILVQGSGTAWIDDIQLEEVDMSVPTTGEPGGGGVAAAPQNLDFEK